MIRPSRKLGIAIVLALVAIGGGLVWYSYGRPKLDIDEVGGTILVYQLGKNPDGVQADDVTRIAEIVQKRCEYSGHRDVAARPGNGDQIEVRIPRVGDHAAAVQSIKDMLSRIGRLEFRILANGHDDKDAIDDTMRMINRDREADAMLDQEIKDAQNEGLPPPGPRDADGNLRKYTVTLARGLKSTVTYRWVELGQMERRDLNLDNAARDDPQRTHVWAEAALHRGEARPLRDIIQGDLDSFRALLAGALFYSRPCEDRNLSETDRRSKAVEYFVLARDPEFDSATGKRTPDIDGRLLSSVYPDRDPTSRPMLGFTFSRAGADLFGTLTRKNVSEVAGPEGASRVRHLAIILDGLVLSAPTINSEIRDRGSISGSFTQKQVDALANILRAGVLPRTLLQLPVQELTIEPNKK
jgi:SecD/SecF fusion protein